MVDSVTLNLKLSVIEILYLIPAESDMHCTKCQPFYNTLECSWPSTPSVLKRNFTRVRSRASEPQRECKMHPLPAVKTESGIG